MNAREPSLRAAPPRCHTYQGCRRRCDLRARGRTRRPRASTHRGRPPRRVRGACAGPSGRCGPKCARAPAEHTWGASALPRAHLRSLVLLSTPRPLRCSNLVHGSWFMVVSKRPDRLLLPLQLYPSGTAAGLVYARHSLPPSKHPPPVSQQASMRLPAAAQARGMAGSWRAGSCARSSMTQTHTRTHTRLPPLTRMTDCVRWPPAARTHERW